MRERGKDKEERLIFGYGDEYISFERLVWTKMKKDGNLHGNGEVEEK